MNERREASLNRRFVSIDKTTRVADASNTVVSLALASEYPVERWYGTEVLSLDPGAVRLDRLNDGAALLFNHNQDDIRGSHVRGSQPARLHQ